MGSGRDRRTHQGRQRRQGGIGIAPGLAQHLTDFRHALAATGADTMLLGQLTQRHHTVLAHGALDGSVGHGFADADIHDV